MYSSNNNNLQGQQQNPILAFSGSSPALRVISKFTQIPANTLGGPTKYFHFYRPKSGYHLIKQICMGNGDPHVTEELDAQVLQDIRSGKCMLVIDNSPEGHINPRNYMFYAALNDLVAELSPAHAIIVIDQNRALTDPSECSEEINSLRNRIKFVNYDFFIKKLALVLALEQPGHSFPSRTEFVSSSKSSFLCMFGTPRAEKVALYKQLIANGLTVNALVSYHGFHLAKAKNIRNSVIDAVSSSYLRSSFHPFIDKSDIETDIDALPLSQLDEIIKPDLNDLALHMPYTIFDKCHASLVVETEFQDTSMQRITEKTFKAFSSGHPCIVFGNPFSIRLVKSLGFDTFEDLINHDYDKIIDPSCRFNAVIAELARLVDLIEADPVRFSNLIFDRARQNYYYAHSQHFLERYEEQVEASLRELLVKFF